jgi:hypothetical protein
MRTRYPGYYSMKYQKVGYQKPSLDGLYFNPKDLKTLAFVKDKSVKWNSGASDLVDVSMFGVVTVYDNNFEYKKVFDNVSSELKKLYPSFSHSFKKTEHCEFCGQSIMYVAIIIAIDKSDPEKIDFRQIGCDCLGKIFGTTWSGFRDADSIKKILVGQAKIRSRKEKYAVKYKHYIDWLNLLPSAILEHKQFLRDMKTVLTTGSKVFSENMEQYLKSLTTAKDYSQENLKTLGTTVESVIAKLEHLLKLVSDTDKDNITKPWSAYEFVNSVLTQTRNNYRVPTLKQMLSINKVYDRYTKIRVKIAPKNASAVTTSQLTNPPTVDMPW